MFLICVATLVAFFLLLTFSSLLRYAMLSRFVSQEVQKDPKNHSAIVRMFQLGIRFDVKAIATVFIIPFGLASVLLLIEKDIAIPFASISFVCFFIFVGIILGNYFYFKTYHNHYDVFAFGLAEDDTKAVLKNIYDDYPVIKLIIFNTLFSGILATIVYLIVDGNSNIDTQSKFLEITVFLVSALLFWLAIRGTVKSKPLGKMHAQVSSVSVINKLVPNGLIALLWAKKDHQRENNFVQVELDEGINLLKNFGAKDNFIEKTPENRFLSENKPHVVLAVMESFGSNLLAFDDEKENDLLGSLRKHFSTDFVFNRFVSTHNGTAPSVMSLYFYSENQNLSQSVAQNKKLPYTAIKPYKDNGYKTIFITSGNGMWRSLSDYMILQGIDEFYDQNDLMDIFPNAKETLSYWGVADEFAFKLAEKLLAESSSPLFINILTISNHPPYQAPKQYVRKPVKPELLVGKIGDSANERRNILESYQYAANALGDFIDNVEKQPFSDKTIIAATGDHHIRSLAFDYPKESFLNVSVPFFLHIPKSYQQTIKFDTNTLGSHKDIMPTLYHLSLSDTEYWNACGQNLFNVNEQHFAFNSALWITQTGVVDIHSYTKYDWADQIKLKAVSIPISEQEKEKITNYLNLLNWQTNYLVGNAVAVAIDKV